MNRCHAIVALAASAAVASATPDAAHLRQAAEHERHGRSREALAAYLLASRQSPGDPAILVKIAKQHGDLMTEMDKQAERRQAAAESLNFARRALQADPKHADAHLAVAIALGKNVEFMGNRAKVEASREIKARAEAALALNPNSDYAHHMLGRWHQGMAELDGATRALARIIYGGLPAASHAQALEHFAKARALRPDRLIHQIEYGRTLALLRRTDEARTELAKGLAMPERDKDDAAAKARGRATLDEI